MKNSKGKIRNINSYLMSDEMEDGEVDSKIRRELILEGKRTEKELENRPELDAIGDAPYLLDKMIQELRQKGEWNDEAYQRALEEETESVRKEEVRTEAETEKEIKSGTETKRRTESAKADTEEHKDDMDRLDQTKYEFAEEDIYQLLSEKDKVALRRGRAIERLEEKWNKNRKKILRAAAVCVVAGSLFTVSMGTEANREHVMRVWTEITSRGQRIFISKSDDSYEGKEEQDRRVIKEELGIDVPQLVYKPTHMTYESCVIDQTIRNARMYYTTKDNNEFMVYMSKESSNAEELLDVDGKILGEHDVYNAFLIKNLKIQKLKTPKKKDLYKTEFIYNDTYYLLMCKMDKNQFDKVIEKMIVD
ncbi:MAG: DUF4367 domain-containing protein [Hominisplanchenecus sp.]